MCDMDAGLGGDQVLYGEARRVREKMHRLCLEHANDRDAGREEPHRVSVKTSLVRTEDPYSKCGGMEKKLFLLEEKIRSLEQDNFVIMCSAEEVKAKYLRTKERNRELKEALKVKDEELKNFWVMNGGIIPKLKGSRDFTGNMEKIVLQTVLKRLDDQQRFVDSRISQACNRLKGLQFKIENVKTKYIAKNDDYDQNLERQRQLQNNIVNDLKLQMRDLAKDKLTLEAKLGEFEEENSMLKTRYNATCEKFNEKTSSLLGETRELLKQKEELVHQYKEQVTCLKEEKRRLFEGKEEELSALRAKILTLKNNAQKG